MSDASKQFKEQAYLIVANGGDADDPSDVIFSIGSCEAVAIGRAADAMQSLSLDIDIEEILDIDAAEEAGSLFTGHLEVLSRVCEKAVMEAREDGSKAARHDALKEAYEIVLDEIRLLAEDDPSSAVAKKSLGSALDRILKQWHTAAGLLLLARS